MSTDDDPHCRALYSLFGSDSIEFCDGSLADFSVRMGPDFVKFSAQPEGPYYAFPMSKRKMIEVFNKPDKIERWGQFF